MALFTCVTITLSAQNGNISINLSGSPSPNPTAILDLSDVSNNQTGLLLPNVSLSDVTLTSPFATTPATGLIVWNTNAATTGGFGVGFYYFDGTQWDYLNNSGTSSSGVTSVTGTAPIVIGGTLATPNVSLLGTSGGIFYGTGAGSSVTAAGSNGAILTTNGTTPSWLGPGGNNQVLTMSGGVPTWQNAASGGVTSISSGTGITCTPNPITSTGTVGITNTGVTAGTYGSTSVVPQITVNAQGQITSETDKTITPASIGMANLTAGTGVTGFTYDGSSAKTVGLANTTVSAGSYGSGTQVGTFTVNAQGQLTAAANTPISITGLGTALTTSSTAPNITLTAGGSNTTALVNAASITAAWTGQLSIANGGTGQSTAINAFNALSPMTTLGDIIFENNTPSATRLPGNTSATKKFLTQTGTGAVSAAPAWGTISGSDVTGSALTIGTADPNVIITLGGTPSTALLQPASITMSWSGTLATSRGGTGLGSIGSANQILGVNNGATGLEYKTVTAGSGITVTNTSGAITIASTGGSGTVTSFSSGNLSPLFTTSVTSSTATPALSFSLSNAGAHTFFGNFTGAAAAPSFGSPALASADFANQGTTTTVLHGSAAGNPSWGAVSLTSDVSGVLPVANGGVNVQVFTSSGTYNPTAGTNKIVVEIVGGGGGGARSSNSGSYSLGGGGSAGSYLKVYSAAPVSTTVTIGPGGAGGNSTSTGTAGTATSFGTNTAPGGNGGTASSNGNGNGGSASGFGFAGINGGTVSNTSGDGGTSIFGNGGAGVTGATNTNVTGNNGSGYGSGGSGAYAERQGTTQTGTGGTGANGLVIVYEYH